MVETKFDVAGVVDPHWDYHYTDDAADLAEYRCGCGVELESSRVDDSHRQHLADVISAHIAATLGSDETRNVMLVACQPWVRFIASDGMGAVASLEPNVIANNALAAVGDLLGVEVGR